jgi:ArsR family transcriptional regulator, virulence genes transcriptional regulator
MNPAEMAQRADMVSSFLKGLANRDRLLILCAFADAPEGERCVAELIAATGIAPTSMSQHLGVLKETGILIMRRAHRTLHYRIAHPATGAVMAVLHQHFCGDEP